MEKMFCLGVALGMVGGALIVANNYKARSLVKKSQREVIDKVNDMLDERLQAMENASADDESGEESKDESEGK